MFRNGNFDAKSLMNVAAKPTDGRLEVARQWPESTDRHAWWFTEADERVAVPHANVSCLCPASNLTSPSHDRIANRNSAS